MLAVGEECVKIYGLKNEVKKSLNIPGLIW